MRNGIKRHDQTYGEHGLHLDHGQISVGVLQLLLVLLDLPLLAPIQVTGVPMGFLLLLQLLGLLFYLSLEFLVLLCSVDKQPSDSLHENS